MTYKETHFTDDLTQVLHKLYISYSIKYAKKSQQIQQRKITMNIFTLIC